MTLDAGRRKNRSKPGDHWRKFTKRRETVNFVNFTSAACPAPLVE